MAPSQIQIATSSLQRLIKEEASYYKEMDQQRVRIAKLEKAHAAGDADEDGNREYQLRQEKKALEETDNVLPNVRERITTMREKLESLLGSEASEAEREKAVDVLKQAKEAQKDDPTSTSKPIATS